MDDLVSDFIAETREGLEALDSELVRFEQKPDDPALLDGIFRLIHTIKGTCGFLGLARLQTVAHAAENVLGGFRDGVVRVSPEAVSAVLDTVDLIRSLVDALAIDGAEPAGDDSFLIARLEEIFAAAPAVDSGPAADPEVEADVAVAPSSDSRSLIDRLGGDATLDAAAEMAVAVMQREDPGFTGVDPDTLQGAVRDGLCGAARAGRGGDLAARVATIVPAAGAAAFHRLVALVAEALADLEVDDDAAARLIGGLQPPAAPAEPEDGGARPAAEPRADISPPALSASASAAAFFPSAPPTRGLAVSAPVAEDVTGVQQTIRVSVDALEHLMTVVSELVLIRNQLIQALRLEPESVFAAPLNRLNQVTSELQEGVMTTRMQPISGAWAKLPRLVRDLAQELGKKIDLSMVGQETELDRQVLELIKDPLTHMIRNAADHGLESPDERRAAGKAETGRISLAARHEGGAIVIEVSDDGRGLSASRIRTKAAASGLATAAQLEALSDADVRQFIFAAGFSTASEVTSVSGRGVGMDVVRTNIEKIGGAIELASTEGAGTRFTIRIPLTLTIVSALIVECCGERFAMPQSSVVELVSASDASGRTVEYIDGAAVLRLRDRLLPLISLQSLLNLDPEKATRGETCIVVARVGAFSFGVIVDRVFDTEEIVVKPVATVLRHLKLYSGATILGDGSVILILDFKGMSIETGASQSAAATREEEAGAAAVSEARTPLLVFRSSEGALKAAPLASVSRIEEVFSDQVECVDGRSVVQYRGRLMPVVGGERIETEPGLARPLLVFARGDRSVGLLVREIVDIVESSLDSELAPAGAGAAGSLIINGSATELIDVAYYTRLATEAPAEAGTVPRAAAPPAPAAARRVLIVDASPFCQLLLRPLLSQAGYEVTVAVDGDAALALHDQGERFHLIMADTGLRGAAARQLAEALGRADSWRKTPLLGLGFQSRDPGGDFDGQEVLSSISDTLDDIRGAA